MRKIILFIFLLSACFAFSTKRNVPGTYASIQAALNASTQGDTVLVQPGTYTENLYWPKVKNIKLFSAGDSSNTIIDANFIGRCLTIIDSTATIIDTNTVISGFKLRNGFSDTCTFSGVAVYGYGTKPVLQNLAITNCNVNAVNTNTYSVLFGGVVYFNSSVIIRSSSFYKNSIYNSNGNIYGGLIYSNNITNPILRVKMFQNEIDISVSNTSNYIYGALIHGNYSLDKISATDNVVNYFGTTTSTNFNGLFGNYNYNFTFQNSLVANNTFSSNTNVTVNSLGMVGLSGGTSYTWSFYNLTIANNKIYTSGTINAISFYAPAAYCGGFCVHGCDIKNCIAWNPFNISNNEIVKATGGIGGLSWVGIYNSDIRSYFNAGLVNTTTVNPQFVSATDFHLQATSPLLNSGIFAGAYTVKDLDNNPIPLPAFSFPDIGCYEMNQTMGTLTPNASVSSNTVCTGQNLCLYNTTPKTKNSYYTYTPSLGNVYAFTGTTTCTSFNAGTYTINLVVTDSLNAIGSSSFVVTVYPSPTVTVNYGNTTLCTGQSATLSTSSTGTITSLLWSNGAVTPTIVVSPTLTTVYSFTYTNNFNCVKSISLTINYTNTPPPSVTITPSSSVICVGQSATLTASSTGTINYYQWTPSLTTSSVVVINPTITTVYTATATNNAYCTSDNSVTITVSLCTDINSNNFKNSQINIYPNPNNGEFVIYYNSPNENSTYEIYNGIGQLIKNGIIEREKIPINLGSQFSGVFIIRVLENKKQILVKKIVVE